jgi:hypothetical protein
MNFVTTIARSLQADMQAAFARIEDPAERVRLAFKLFDYEGVALVNLLSDGSGALEQMRERARDSASCSMKPLCAMPSVRAPSSTRSPR